MIFFSKSVGHPCNTIAFCRSKYAHIALVNIAIHADAQPTLNRASVIPRDRACMCAWSTVTTMQTRHWRVSVDQHIRPASSLDLVDALNRKAVRHRSRNPPGGRVTNTGVPKLWSAALRWSAGWFEVVPRDNTMFTLIVCKKNPLTH